MEQQQEQAAEDLLEDFAVFRVCDLQHNNRQMIGCPPNINSVLEHGALAMRKDVNRILLASDGCEITSDLVLIALQGQMMMLLSPGETWMPYGSSVAPCDASINLPYLFQDQKAGIINTSLSSAEHLQPTGEYIEEYAVNVLLNPPASASKSPTPASKSPTLASKSPTPASMSSTSASKSPTPASKSPTSASKSPTSASKSPTLASKSPTPASKSPTSASKSPTSASKSPTLASKSPTPASKSPTSASKSPASASKSPESAFKSSESCCEDSSDNEENRSPNVQLKRPADPISVEKKKRRATTDMKFQSFQINWSKVSERLLKQLDQLQSFRNTHSKQPVPREKRVTKDDLNALVVVVVDQLRTIDNAISAGTMDAVAKQITARYPCLDFPDDDGVKDNKGGHVGIRLKLIHRNSYMNRFKEQGVATQSRAEKAKLRHVQSGTLKEYWENTSKQCSSHVKSVLQRDEPALLTSELLAESQAHVRYLFDSGDLDELLSRLPILRRTVLLNFHFEKATGVNISDLSKYFLAKKEKIIDFSRTSKKRTLGVEATSREIFEFLTLLVDEKIDDLIIQKEMGTNISAITTNEAGPVLVCIDMGDGGSLYYVFAEKTRLTEGTTCLLEAVQNLMAVYYVHNFMYVKSCSKILELIQEYFLKILPITGSKSQATRVAGRQRVVKRVILALSEHDVNASA